MLFGFILILLGGFILARTVCAAEEAPERWNARKVVAAGLSPEPGRVKVLSDCSRRIRGAGDRVGHVLLRSPRKLA